jgi:hypothetical protein
MFEHNEYLGNDEFLQSVDKAKKKVKHYANYAKDFGGPMVNILDKILQIPVVSQKPKVDPNALLTELLQGITPASTQKPIVPKATNLDKIMGLLNQ